MKYYHLFDCILQYEITYIFIVGNMFWKLCYNVWLPWPFHHPPTNLWRAVQCTVVNYLRDRQTIVRVRSLQDKYQNTRPNIHSVHGFTEDCTRWRRQGGQPIYIYVREGNDIMHLCRWEKDKEKGLIGRDWIKRELFSANWLSKNPIKSSSVVKYYHVYLRDQWILIGRPRGTVYRNYYCYYSYIVVLGIYTVVRHVDATKFYYRFPATVAHYNIPRQQFLLFINKNSGAPVALSLLDRIVWGSENSTRIITSMMLPSTFTPDNNHVTYHPSFDHDPSLNHSVISRLTWTLDPD